MDSTLAAGRLRHRITLMQPSAAVDSFGGPGAPTVFATVWASISPMSGQEIFRASQFTSEANIQIIMRYMPGVLPKMTVLYGTRSFVILAVLNEDERNVKLTLLSKELL